MGERLNYFDVIQGYPTESERRQRHRRFGHPSAQRLVDLLKKANHEDFERKAIEKLTRYCHFCQKHGKSPNQFKFTLREEDNM